MEKLLETRTVGLFLCGLCCSWTNFMVELKTKDLILDKGKSREIVIAENIDLVRLLDLSADFGDKRNAKMTPIFKLREKSKTGIPSCL